MPLNNPYFYFIILKDSIINDNYVNNRWLYIEGTDGLVSGQTDASKGGVAINVQDAANSNGDLLTIYDGTFKYQNILNTSTPSTRLFLYQNASNVNDIVIASNSDNNEVFLTVDNYIGKDVNIKTMSY